MVSGECRSERVYMINVFLVFGRNYEHCISKRFTNHKHRNNQTIWLNSYIYLLTVMAYQDVKEYSNTLNETARRPLLLPRNDKLTHLFIEAFPRHYIASWKGETRTQEASHHLFNLRGTEKRETTRRTEC